MLKKTALLVFDGFPCSSTCKASIFVIDNNVSINANSQNELLIMMLFLPSMKIFLHIWVWPVVEKLATVR